MQDNERQNRLIAFVVITIVFVVSVGALLYWAINVATARISSKTSAHFDALNPLVRFAERDKRLTGFVDSVTVWRVF